jgi:hypothetical protein
MQQVPALLWRVVRAMGRGKSFFNSWGRTGARLTQARCVYSFMCRDYS